MENYSNIFELDLLCRGALVALYAHIWNRQEVVYLQAVRGERKDPLVRAGNAEAFGREGVSWNRGKILLSQKHCCTRCIRILVSLAGNTRGCSQWRSQLGRTNGLDMREVSRKGANLTPQKKKLRWMHVISSRAEQPSKAWEVGHESENGGWKKETVRSRVWCRLLLDGPFEQSDKGARVAYIRARVPNYPGLIVSLQCCPASSSCWVFAHIPSCL